MMAKKESQIFQLKVTLKGIRPPIWRRILVKGNTTLLQLHDILQAVMGWYDYHLHVFFIGEKYYGDPQDDEYDDFGTLDECDYRLVKVISGQGQRFTYEYDFGDGWEHDILVEKILEAEKGGHYPVCIKGKRACPPEDVGGIWGYENFLEAIHNPDHEEHDEYLEWIGGEFDPEEFDLEAINEALQSMKLRRTRNDDAWEISEEEIAQDVANEMRNWMADLSTEQQDFAEKLPLRRDMVSLLNYMRDTKVIGTTSTGNFPLKAVAEICARFVEPVKLETKIGDRVYKVRSESEVWPLYFRHALASVSGFITGGPGRRWVVLPGGEKFLALTPAIQIWILIANWWIKINWAITFPAVVRSDVLDLDFRLVALRHLQELPLATHVDYKTFADKMIEDSRLVWPGEDQKHGQYLLRAIIERAVIKPHIDFGVLEAKYQPDEILGEEYRQITSIAITPFGKSILALLKNIAFSQ